jgi:hypothetical protein
MSDTPETDAFQSSGKAHYMALDFARKLERERDEARAERDILKLDAQREAEHHDRMVGELEKVYKERDEAREDARLLSERLTALELQSSEELARLERQRNEVICELRIWKNGKYELDT